MNYSLVVVAIFFIFILFKVLTIVKKNKEKTKIIMLSKKADEINVKEFLKLRQDKVSKKYILKNDFQGVYVLFNKKKKIYYVGQSVNVLKRVNNHFTGKGNGDVYADFKYGDNFTIQTIPLENSGFSNLNDLEKQAITVFKAYKKGYNKTRGNKNKKSK